MKPAVGVRDSHLPLLGAHPGTGAVCAEKTAKAGNRPRRDTQERMAPKLPDFALG